MDLSSPFKSEVFKPIVSVLIPGALAGVPYALVIGHYFPDLATYRDDHEVAFFSIATLIVIGIGFVLEDLGSCIEAVFDSLLKKNKHKDFDDVWAAYLKLAFDKEPIAQRYLRTVLLRMKFELSAAVSLVFCYGGLVWLSGLKSLFSGCALLGLGFALLLLAGYLLWEAYKGAGVLANTRRLMVGKEMID